MTGIASLERLLEILRGQGVRTTYVKHLSANQGHEKNQIYLGRGLDGVNAASLPRVMSLLYAGSKKLTV